MKELTVIGSETRLGPCKTQRKQHICRLCTLLQHKIEKSRHDELSHNLKGLNSITGWLDKNQVYMSAEDSSQEGETDKILGKFTIRRCLSHISLKANPVTYLGTTWTEEVIEEIERISHPSRICEKKWKRNSMMQLQQYAMMCLKVVNEVKYEKKNRTWLY
jgi:hypothetical protein